MEHAKTDHLRVVALPGICARIVLPQAPNYLSISTGGQIDLGHLHPDDITMLGMAMARDLRRHWHPRMQKVERLGTPEAHKVGAQLLHDGMAEAIAKKKASAQGFSWCDLSTQGRAERIEQVRQTLAIFLEEMNR